MRTIFLSSVFLVILFSVANCQTLPKEYKPYYENNYQLSKEEKTFLDTLQYKTFLYFVNEINPNNGMVKDRSTPKSPSSIAAVGFALPIWAIGAEKGWISKEKATELTLNTLRFFWNSEQSDNKLATGRKGFYYHFLDMESGKRFWNCELSSIDSGILFAGMIFARNYYLGDSKNETEIRDLCNKLIERANYDYFTQSENAKYPNAISMGWNEKENILEISWWGYTEALFLYIIAAGMDMQKAELGYDTWLKYYQWREPYKNLGHVVFPALFSHQYSMMFLDMRGWVDKYMKKKGIDYFENSRRAVYTQWNYGKQNPNNWVGYDSLTWGWTASDGPGESYNKDGKYFYGYAARGNAGPDSVEFDDGCIVPTAAGGSVPFAPELTVPTLMNMYDRYSAAGVWGKYGFYDAFNPTINWVNSDFLGIDQGPIVVMIENYFNGFVWKYFMKDPIVKKGLQRLGFEKVDLSKLNK